MKICCVADTHCQHRSIVIPQCDLIIFAGDITSCGEERTLIDFNAWVGGLGTPVIGVAGNHDLILERYPGIAVPLLNNITYLRDEETEFHGLKIYGSPMARRVGHWAFGYDPINATRCWSKIPDGIDILVTHGPPEGIRDTVYPGHPNLGCPALLDAVRRVKPKLHIFGHIHPGHGLYKNPSTTFINASVLNDDYKMVYKPIVIEI